MQKIFIQDNAFENVCKMAAVLSRPKFIKEANIQNSNKCQLTNGLGNWVNSTYRARNWLIDCQMKSGSGTSAFSQVTFQYHIPSHFSFDGYDTVVLLCKVKNLITHLILSYDNKDRC